MSKAKQPYTVEVDDDGCPHCGAARTWTIVGPDGVAAGFSTELKADLDYYAEMLNEAYALGKGEAAPGED